MILVEFSKSATGGKAVAIPPVRRKKIGVQSGSSKLLAQAGEFWLVEATGSTRKVEFLRLVEGPFKVGLEIENATRKKNYGGSVFKSPPGNSDFLVFSYALPRHLGTQEENHIIAQIDRATMKILYVGGHYDTTYVDATRNLGRK